MTYDVYKDVISLFDRHQNRDIDLNYYYRGFTGCRVGNFIFNIKYADDVKDEIDDLRVV